MKNYLLTILFLIFAFTSKAQTGNAVLFSENGEQFTVMMNGIAQNALPSTNVKMTNLNPNFYKVTVVFTDASIPTKDFNLLIEAGQESTFALHKNGNGEYKLNGVNKTAIGTGTGNGNVNVGMNVNG